MTQRVLKFRAWDRLENKMITPETQQQQHYTLSLSGRFFNLHNGSGGSEYDVSQFTGFLDSRGEEIYEGDIVLNRSGEKGTVTFDHDQGRWVAIGSLDSAGSCLLTVAGNTYSAAKT